MDAERLNALSDQQRALYANLQAVFQLKGWAQIEAWIADEARQADDRQKYANSWDANRLARGQHLAFESMARFRENIEAEFEQHAESALDARKTEDEQRFE